MKLIVSLTSWKKRIGTANITIESILNQTRKADSVELNLDYENFPNGLSDLPDSITELEKSGKIKIFFEEKDLKVYEKLYPTIMRHKEEDVAIATLDDDVTYPESYLDEIYNTLKHSDWLCTKDNYWTFGQYMAYGPKAVKAIAKWVNTEFMENVPLDDHGIIMILLREKLIRGTKNNSVCEDREYGHSFRRFFVTGYDVEKLTDKTCNYPLEQFRKEDAYMHKIGLI